MTWMLAHKDEHAIVQEIEQQSDRGAAIIAAAMVEERLADAIRSRLHPMSKTLRERIFEGYGALATFAAKIDLGFAMGLFGPTACGDLRHIQWIRNRFAHRIRPPMSFDVEIIRRRCNALKLPTMIAHLMQTAKRYSTRDGRRPRNREGNTLELRRSLLRCFGAKRMRKKTRFLS